MLCPSSIWHQDLNPRPSEHKSPPITTRLGLPPLKKKLVYIKNYHLTYLGNADSSKSEMNLLRNSIIHFCPKVSKAS